MLLLVVFVGFVLEVAFLAVKEFFIFIFVIFAEDIVDIRLLVVLIIKGHQLCLPIQGLLRNEAEDIEEAIKVGIGSELQGLGGNLHDGSLIEVGVIKEGDAVSLIKIFVLFIYLPGLGNCLILNVI